MGSVDVKRAGAWRRLCAFAGPAYLVSVGYMDPGNWATDIAGGAQFGYALMWVLLLANGMALLLQTLASRLGVVTGLDLAQGCRREYPRPVCLVLWGLSEIAIAATDLAEILGTVIGLNLLFGLPLLWGCAVTALDTFLLLAIQRLGIRRMEAFILMLVGTIAGCFLIEVFLAKPDWSAAAAGLRPTLPAGSLFVALGIIGATVMPHNLFLHSALVQSRAIDRTYTGRAEACRYNLIDAVVALNGAFFVNAAILVMSAASFHARHIVVTEIQQAYHLLQPILGSQLAPLAFGVALLASGQSSTLTGTLSGQVVMEGFLDLHMQPWIRRLVTRSLALLPAVVVISVSGSAGVYTLLIASQVVLSLQLPFAVVPLVHFTSQRQKMGVFANPRWLQLLAWLVTAVIIGLNAWLVADALMAPLAAWPWLAQAGLWLVVTVLAGLLIYQIGAPFFCASWPWDDGLASPGADMARQMRPPAMRNIGVALENGPGDAAVVAMAVALARPNHARLALIHVVESPGGMVYGQASSSLRSRTDQVYVEGLARAIEGPELPVDVVVRTGKPVEVLVATAGELGLDMLVMGAHGHRGWQDLVFGETVHGVRHSLTIPVMVVRTGKPRDG